MSSFPNFAEIKAWASSPAPDFVVARGRYLVGALALGGAFFVFGVGDPASAATGSSATSKYTIKAGDTLSGVASKFGTTVANIVSVNTIADANKITAGKTLTIPAKGSKVTTSAAPNPPVAATAKGLAVAQTSSKVSVGASSSGQPLPDALVGTSRAALNSTFNNAAAKYGVPAELLKALAYQESGWNNSKVSSVGAIGIGQLTPDTIDFVNTSLLTKPLDAKVASQNIEMSAVFLKYLLNQTNNDQTLALAAYYQGLGALKSVGMYQDTKVYISNVSALKARWF